MPRTVNTVFYYSRVRKQRKGAAAEVKHFRSSPFIEIRKKGPDLTSSF